MRFRIVEEKVGNQSPTFSIQRKRWWGWSTITEYYYDSCYTLTFSSYEKALNYIHEWYPTKTKIINEIVII